ncbi:MAG: aminodeoxychorismate synthase component I [Spirochaetota bacterium]
MDPIIIMRDGDRWASFTGAVGVHIARTRTEVMPVLDAVMQAVKAGNCAAGFISYEASPAFDDALLTHAPSGMLAYFAVYERMVGGTLSPARGAYDVSALSPRIDRGSYDRAFSAIRERLAAGDTYQVNYTFPFTASFTGDAFSYFSDRVRRYAPPHAAFIDMGDDVIASFSPELFFTHDGDTILSRPMKGTRPRGRTSDDDRRNAEELGASAKDRAENLMIVDMIRNDIGRIAEVGSVAVPGLYTMERHPYVWQMTSTVSARTKGDLSGIMRAMFPCASVTGAPKASTMRIIRDSEPYPRGVYTGAIGFMTQERMQFSVAIRTAVIEKKSGTLTYHAGSGIVWDSTAGNEYDECIAKTKALDMLNEPVTLIESMRYDASGFYLFDRHIERLLSSAAYFGIPLDTASITDALRRYADGLPVSPAKVRLIVKHDGSFTIMHEPVASVGGNILRVALAAEPVDEDDVMLRHKHTERVLYDRAKASVPDADDVLLWNTRREVTEASSSNIVYRMKGRYWTPPVSSGLLPGTLRTELIARGIIFERVLRIDELSNIERLYLINSVRKCRKAAVSMTGSGSKANLKRR